MKRITNENIDRALQDAMPDVETRKAMINDLAQLEEVIANYPEIVDRTHATITDLIARGVWGTKAGASAETVLKVIFGEGGGRLVHALMRAQSSKLLDALASVASPQISRVLRDLAARYGHVCQDPEMWNRFDVELVRRIEGKYIVRIDIARADGVSLRASGSLDTALEFIIAPILQVLAAAPVSEFSSEGSLEVYRTAVEKLDAMLPKLALQPQSKKNTKGRSGVNTKHSNGVGTATH